MPLRTQGGGLVLFNRHFGVLLGSRSGTGTGTNMRNEFCPGGVHKCELWAHCDDALGCHSCWTMQPYNETRKSQNKPFPSFNLTCLRYKTQFQEDG